MQRYTVSELMRSALDSPGPHWQNRVPIICEYGLTESEMAGLCPGQQGKVRSLCARRALGLSVPAWCTPLPPVSEDKRQYNVRRGRKGGDQQRFRAYESSRQGATATPTVILPGPFRMPTSLIAYQGNWPHPVHGGARRDL